MDETKAINVQVSITRAANATAYTINDVMNDTTLTTMLNFPVAKRNNGSGWVVGGTMTSNGGQATQPDIDLLLFSKNFTIEADNAALTLADTEVDDYIGRIRFNSFSDIGSESICDGALENPIAFKSAADTKSIYGILLMQNAYTPVSGEILTINLSVLQE